jgi:putative ABC transport system substrate-binding protein
MKRRHFLELLCGAALWPLAVRAQHPRGMHRVAYIAPLGRAADVAASKWAKALLQGLAALGYVEGRNLVLEWRTAEGKYERVPEIVRELATANADVIVTTTSSLTKAVRDATQTIPIVMAAAGSPVERGVVQSLARPGGNVTGLTIDTDVELFSKRVQFLKELLPGMTRMAFLWPGRQLQPTEPETVEAAARAVGVRLFLAEFAGTEYDRAFALIVRERPDALLVSVGAANFARRKLIAEFAAKNRLAAMYSFPEAVESGGLIAYGVELADLFRRAAGYVDKILKGAKPADLPVERPTKFQLLINLKTAKALGLEVPPLLLAQANEVIE